MASDNVVEVRFGANVADLRRGTEEATNAVQGIQDRLREFKSEAVSTGRQAKFFASELAAIIPGADGAKAALRDLIAVGLSGSAIGAAIEGVKLIVAVFHELGAEEAKAKDAAQKYGEDTGKLLESVTKRVDGLLLSWRHLSDVQTLVATDQKSAEEAVTKATDASTAAQQKLADARFAANAALASQKNAKDFDLLVEAAIRKPAEAYAAALADLQKAQDNLIAIKAKIADAAKGETGEKQRKARQTELNQEFEDLKAARIAENVVSADFASRDLEMRQKTFDKEQEAQAKALQAQFDELRKVREDESLVDSRLLAKNLADQQKELAKYVANVKQVADRISSAFAGAFTSIIDGSKNAGDAMIGMFRSLAAEAVAAVLKLAAETIAAAITGKAAAKLEALSTTEGHIAEAVSGAYASQAFIPFIGPALGAAAAAETLATLEGITAPLLSAARGADLPSGGPFPMIAHSREMMLPEEHADVIRGLAAERGGGGMELHFHGTVIDASSVKRFVNSDEFRNAVAGARRSGRLSF